MVITVNAFIQLVPAQGKKGVGFAVTMQCDERKFCSLNFTVDVICWLLVREIFIFDHLIA